MSITNYGQLKAAVANWLNRADLDQRIPEFIALGFATLNKVVRSSHMVAHDSVTIASGERYGAVPADMLEPIFVTHDSEDAVTLEQVSVQQLNWLRKRMSAAGTPRFFAIVGRRIEVCPTPAAQITLEMAHYEEIPALSGDNDTNWVIQNDPDLILYTALLHASPFLKDEGKTALFGTLVAQQVAAAVQQQKTIQFDSKTPGPTLNAPADVR